MSFPSNIQIKGLWRPDPDVKNSQQAHCHKKPSQVVGDKIPNPARRCAEGNHVRVTSLDHSFLFCFGLEVLSLRFLCQLLAADSTE